MLKKYLQHLLNRDDLPRIGCQEAILKVFEDETPVEQTAAFLALLHAKGETAEEILGVIDALKQHMQPVVLHHKVLDIVGTGGDGAGSINLSTGAAILAASCGVKIAKHGNRAVSSLCGSADVLEALKINIHLSADAIAACIEAFGMGFYFAPNFNPLLTQLKTIRRHLAIPTVLNLVGPFLNPAQPKHYLMGVSSPRLLPVYADILSKLTVGKSVVVHSEGLDEMSCCGETQVIEIENGQKKSYKITPKMLGLTEISRDALKGGDANTNATILRAALSGEKSTVSESLILNAAMAIYLYGLEKNLPSAVARAQENLYQGCALEVLKKWQCMS
ncbi:MAG: anthranilate phosphoribosyltransferase [Gammaproteobacteria bacterium]